MHVLKLADKQFLKLLKNCIQYVDKINFGQIHALYD